MVVQFLDEDGRPPSSATGEITVNEIPLTFSCAVSDPPGSQGYWSCTFGNADWLAPGGDLDAERGTFVLPVRGDRMRSMNIDAVLDETAEIDGEYSLDFSSAFPNGRRCGPECRTAYLDVIAMGGTP